MKKIFSPYFWFECILTVFIFCVMGCVGYVYFLNHSTRDCISARERDHHLHALLTQKKSGLLHEQLVKRQLQQWQQKDLAFYTAIHTSTDNNAIAQGLSALFIHDGFSITQMKPLPMLTSDAQNALSLGNVIEFKLSGSFQQLIVALASLNEFAFPVTVTAIKINRATAFDLQIAAWSSHD